MATRTSVPKAIAQQNFKDRTISSLSSTNNTQEPNTTNNIDDNGHDHTTTKPLEPPTIIYHESAHSIVFRDHLRRAHDAIVKKESRNNTASSSSYCNYSSSSDSETTGGGRERRRTTRASTRSSRNAPPSPAPPAPLPSTVSTTSGISTITSSPSMTNPSPTRIMEAPQRGRMTHRNYTQSSSLSTKTGGGTRRRSTSRASSCSSANSNHRQQKQQQQHRTNSSSSSNKNLHDDSQGSSAVGDNNYNDNNPIVSDHNVNNHILRTPSREEEVGNEGNNDDDDDVTSEAGSISSATTSNSNNSILSLDDSVHDFFTGGLSLNNNTTNHNHNNNNKNQHQNLLPSNNRKKSLSKSKKNVKGRTNMSNKNTHTHTHTSSTHTHTTPTVVVANFTPVIDPLPALELKAQDEFIELLDSSPFLWNTNYTNTTKSTATNNDDDNNNDNNNDSTDNDNNENNTNLGGPEEAIKNPQVWNKMTQAEQEVSQMIQQQTCVVKTIKNSDWTAFLHKFPVKENDFVNNNNNNNFDKVGTNSRLNGRNNGGDDDGGDGGNDTVSCVSEGSSSHCSSSKQSGGGRWSVTAGPKASLSAHRYKYIEYPTNSNTANPSTSTSGGGGGVSIPENSTQKDIEDKNNSSMEKRKMFPFHSFLTSVSLLPSCGVKMRCYGSHKEYGTGVVFALPSLYSRKKIESGDGEGEGEGEGSEEDEAAKRSKIWSWPCGYAAKTEFNIDKYGNLLNGRDEYVVSIGDLRRMNHTYVYEKNYEILGRKVNGELKVLPYNEIYARVGGLGRIVNKEDVCMNKKQGDDDNVDSYEYVYERTFDDGLGLPVALFARSAKYTDLIALLRLRARMGAILGRDHIHAIPLLLITPEDGIRVLTEELQKKLLHVMSNNLNPFQNSTLKHKTQMNNVSEEQFEQKLQELLDLDDDNIRDILTPEECARLAGGFGATDDSVAHLLMDAVVEDFAKEDNSSDATLDSDTASKLHNGKLQDLVNEGLSAAVRSGDYNTSRQLLILYTLVAAKGQQTKDGRSPSIEMERNGETNGSNGNKISLSHASDSNSLSVSDIISNTSACNANSSTLSNHSIPPPPPPPPLDTDRLRSATNSDGLLAVLGAAEVLKAMKDGNAKNRTMEAIKAIEEWICKSENSVAFRLASWRDLRAAQGDLKIATENDSNFMAFISNKAIMNRKKFAKELKEAVSNTSFESISFLRSVHAILSTMHNPCLRLELLQFILGLDNRYSVAHVRRSVELAATCLNVSATEAVLFHNNDNPKELEKEIHNTSE